MLTYPHGLFRDLEETGVTEWRLDKRVNSFRRYYLWREVVDMDTGERLWRKSENNKLVKDD